LIEVEYKLFETIASPEEALKQPEPRSRLRRAGQHHRLQSYEFGDVGALASPTRLRRPVFLRGNTTCDRAARFGGAPDGEGKLTLWSSTQGAALHHRALARALQMPASQIASSPAERRRLRRKCDLHNHEIVVSRAALSLERPSRSA